MQCSGCNRSIGDQIESVSRLLRCSHSLCASCIVSLLKKKDEGGDRCPYCSTPILPPGAVCESGEEELAAVQYAPINFAVMSLVADLMPGPGDEPGPLLRSLQLDAENLHVLEASELRGSECWYRAVYRAAGVETRCLVRCLSPALRNVPEAVEEYRAEARRAALVGLKVERGLAVLGLCEARLPEGEEEVPVSVYKDPGRDMRQELYKSLSRSLDDRATLRWAADILRALRSLAALGLPHHGLRPEAVFAADDGGALVAPPALPLEVRRRFASLAPELFPLSPLFQSPEEILSGEEGVEAHPPSVMSDIWSLGCLVKFMRTGDSPWGPEAAALTVPLQRGHLINRLLRPRPGPATPSTPSSSAAAAASSLFSPGKKTAGPTAPATAPRGGPISPVITALTDACLARDPSSRPPAARAFDMAARAVEAERRTAPAETLCPVVVVLNGNRKVRLAVPGATSVAEAARIALAREHRDPIWHTISGPGPGSDFLEGIEAVEDLQPPDSALTITVTIPDDRGGGRGAGGEDPVTFQTLEVVVVRPEALRRAASRAAESNITAFTIRIDPFWTVRMLRSEVLARLTEDLGAAPPPELTAAARRFLAAHCTYNSVQLHPLDPLDASVSPQALRDFSCAMAELEAAGGASDVVFAVLDRAAAELFDTQEVRVRAPPRTPTSRPEDSSALVSPGLPLLASLRRRLTKTIGDWTPYSRGPSPIMDVALTPYVRGNEASKVSTFAAAGLGPQDAIEWARDARDAPPCRVHVRLLSGAELRLDVSPRDSVGVLRGWIHLLTGVPPASQRLLRGGREADPAERCVLPGSIPEPILGEAHEASRARSDADPTTPSPPHGSRGAGPAVPSPPMTPVQAFLFPPNDTPRTPVTRLMNRLHQAGLSPAHTHRAGPQQPQGPGPASAGAPSPGGSEKEGADQHKPVAVFHLLLSLAGVS